MFRLATALAPAHAGFTEDKVVASPMPVEHSVGACALENKGELFGLATGDNQISVTPADENGKITEVPNDVGGKRCHRAKKRGSREAMRIEENRSRGAVRSVGIPDCDPLLRAEIVAVTMKYASSSVQNLRSSTSKTPSANGRPASERLTVIFTSRKPRTPA
jgi:hypothetical protein